MGKDSAIFELVAGRAVIKGVIYTDAGTGRKAKTDGKTYGRLQGYIGKHPGGWQAASGSTDKESIEVGVNDKAVWSLPETALSFTSISIFLW